MYKTILAVLLAFSLSGCITLPRFPTPSAPKKPETVYSWKEEITTTPKAVTTPDKVIVLQETTKTLSVNYEKSIPKQTFAQRIGKWISGLGTLAIICLIIGLVLFPGATMGFMIKQIFKWRQALIETSKAIKEANLKRDDPILHDSLRTHQSTKTQKLIGQIKPMV